MGMDIYDFTIWPVGDAYRQLLRIVSANSEMVGFVIRPGEARFSEPAKRLLADLERDLITAEQVWSWPGSEMSSSSRPYEHRLYRCIPRVVSLLEVASSSFGDWVSPGLPEDLHFLRSDKSVVLGSIGHERFVWMKLSADEASRMRRELPSTLEGSLRRRRP